MTFAQTSFELFLSNLSFPEPLPMAWHKPLTLGWWGKCSTTVVLPLSNRFCTFFPQFYLSRWHQPWRYSNPWPLDDEKSVLPLCYTNNHCTFTLYCLLLIDSNNVLTELLILGCWGKWSSILLPQLSKRVCTFPDHFLHTSDICHGMMWALDLGMLRQVFYLLATSTVQFFVHFPLHYLYHGDISHAVTWTLDLWMMRRVFYHCALSTDFVL